MNNVLQDSRMKRDKYESQVQNHWHPCHACLKRCPLYILKTLRRNKKWQCWPSKMPNFKMKLPPIFILGSWKAFNSPSFWHYFCSGKHWQKFCGTFAVALKFNKLEFEAVCLSFLSSSFFPLNLPTATPPPKTCTKSNGQISSSKFESSASDLQP